MNKVVCNICGTSYPENVSQCPICGFVRSSDSSRVNGESTYTRVPGGRFSKANVRKRNQSAQKKVAKPVPDEKPSKKNNEKSSVGLVIVVVLLLVAIIAVVGYIAMRFFLPDNSVFDDLKKISISSIFKNEETEPSEEIPVITEPPLTEAPQTEAAPVFCEEIILDQHQINCDAIGATYQIDYQLTPADPEEDVLFFSSDAEVATVDGTGLITVKAEGIAIITVSCGSASAQCEVICALPAEDTVAFTLNRKEITFTSEGESWLLYDGPVDVSNILWTSDDNNVATIDSGRVSAVGNGDTTVYGVYGDQTVSCSIHCNFDGEDTTEVTSNVSEATGDSSYKTYGPYTLYNPYGYAEDVTAVVGSQFYLRLVDAYQNTVKDAQWSVKDTNICTYTDGVVKVLASGTTKIVATYEGQTYTCIVRVN